MKARRRRFCSSKDSEQVKRRNPWRCQASESVCVCVCPYLPHPPITQNKTLSNSMFMNIMIFPRTSLNALRFPDSQGKTRKHSSELCWPPWCPSSCPGPAHACPCPTWHRSVLGHVTTVSHGAAQHPNQLKMLIGTMQQEFFVGCRLDRFGWFGKWRFWPEINIIPSFAHSFCHHKTNLSVHQGCFRCFFSSEILSEWCVSSVLYLEIVSSCGQQSPPFSSRWENLAVLVWF